jgi:hypothetical protein
MRLAYFDGVFDMFLLLKAFLINIVYMIGGISFLLLSYSYARNHGLLLGNGE